MTCPWRQTAAAAGCMAVCCGCREPHDGGRCSAPVLCSLLRQQLRLQLLRLCWLRVLWRDPWSSVFAIGLQGNMVDLAARDRNHASIIFWSFCNEVGACTPAHAPAVGTGARACGSFAHRPTA